MPLSAYYGVNVCMYPHDTRYRYCASNDVCIGMYVTSPQDVGVYREARHLLDEGEAYITMPTQQKVMAKVCGV